MTDDAIWNAFAVRLGTFAAGMSPDVPVIYAGVHGTPPDTGSWIEARYFPNRTQKYGIANEGPISLVGFCQALVCVRPGAGLALDLVDLVVAHFDTGTVLGPAKVEMPPYVSSVIEESDRIMHPITIPYAAHGTR
ncbi:phage tail terminator-like protein [Panacagrimonas sp.]|uniref:phage tail terminator-like protein n=1 Tax=Panacagrimonas sp. TaxID=2480088 RepID=UPI003B52AFDC